MPIYICEHFQNKHDRLHTVWLALQFKEMEGKNASEQSKQARKSSEDTHFTGYARFEKVWAG